MARFFPFCADAAIAAAAADPTNIALDVRESSQGLSFKQGPPSQETAPALFGRVVETTDLAASGSRVVTVGAHDEKIRTAILEVDEAPVPLGLELP